MKMTKVIDVVALFYKWMDGVNDKLDFDVHRHAGHITEILQSLQQIDNAGKAASKYPAVFLITDVRERVGIAYGAYQEINVDFLIVNTTKNTYRVDERRQKNFIPVLWPIYKALIETLMNAPEVTAASVEDLPHTKIDCYYLGRNAVFGNIAHTLNDYVDAVQVEGLKIKLKTQFC